MTRLIRTLMAATLTLGLVGPFSMATSLAQAPAASGASQTAGTVNGNIRDSSGAPIANATVTLSGPQTATKTTDARGNFSFQNVTAGVYSFTATKPGYNTASESVVTVLAGQTSTLAVVMNVISFTSLRTIASVRSVGRGTFNTTPASVNVVTSQTIQDQAQPQIMKVLNETPGIVASLPQTSANGAAPGAITFPNIRGALSFETASLVDGHPVSVGTFGDYVTTFLNPFMLQNVELVKGPGADAPEVNYAIGGTVNFRTKDPSYQPSGLMQAGIDNWGSSIFNFGLSDTVGRLGYVLAYGSNDLESNVGGSSTFVSPQSPQQGVLNFNGTTGTAAGFNNGFPAPVINGTISSVTNTFYLVACCQKVAQDLYQNRSELLKLRYQLSPATHATFTYLGSQTRTNQTANTGDITHSNFTLTGSGASAAQIAAYNGAIPNNSTLNVGFVRTPEFEINNEPILEGEIGTTLGKDSLLGRYYSAGIHRLLYQGSAGIPNGNPTIPTVEDMQLYGYDSATKTMYTGQTVPVTFFDYFNQAEDDVLKGWSFEWDHPLNANDAITFTYDSTRSTTTSYSAFASGGPSAGRPFNVSTLGSAQSISIPSGSAQTFGTAMLRGFFVLNSKMNVTFSNYFNTYRSTYATTCTSGCSFSGAGFQFATTTQTHYDPRLALEYRPNASAAFRFSAGSAIAPPYLNLLSQLNRPISYRTGAAFATQQINSGVLQPETAFGYDVGGDYRFADGVTVISADVYLENLYNHFLSGTFNSGQTCPAIDPVTGAPTNCPANTPLFYTHNINLANSRFQGLEIELRRLPTVGFGYTLQGALQKGYPYNLPAYFYCSTPGPGCTPNTNLAIITGQNFYGGGISGSGLSPNGLSNQNVPYSQGYGELNYRTLSGWYGNVNMTYYGPNNSLNEPAFTVLGATVRAPLGNGLTFQVSGDNLSNKYSAVWPVFGAATSNALTSGSAGVPIPLANGQFAATQANNLPPRTFRFLLTKTFGQGANATP